MMVRQLKNSCLITKNDNKRLKDILKLHAGFSVLYYISVNHNSLITEIKQNDFWSPKKSGHTFSDENLMKHLKTFAEMSV